MAKTISQRLDQTREIRDAVLDRMAGRITENHNSYSVNDRSISKMTLDELAGALKHMNGEVRRLEREHRRNSGQTTMLKARF
jgi:hypothetical protein